MNAPASLAPAITLKPAPVGQHRRAVKLPCDGLPRYKVGKLTALTYSEAYDAIAEESVVGKTEEGKPIYKRGTTKRLADLNKVYFRIAKDFICAEIERKQKETADRQQQILAAASTDIDDGIEPGTMLEEAVGEKKVS